MGKIDCNCLIGHWPFRMLRESGIDAIKAKHMETGISYGLVANMNSIFYNDPLEGEAELAAILKGTDYLHVMTVNPMLPGFEEDIQVAADMYNICAVRIYPGYHQYRLDSNKYVERLCTVLHEKELPLFISIRLEDERLNYILKPLTPEEFGLYEFLNQEPLCKILLLTIRLNELLAYREQILANRKIWYDTSGLKDKPFGLELLFSKMGTDKLIYGSQYPLFSLRSTLYLVEHNNLEESIVDNILWNNAQNLLGRSKTL
ncbi:MAG TPA: hypothetical protein GX527_10590 [Clostridiaceae bacterium]|jgi:hypothetical protein|nr:hypothetical protein [Clostridiaceae bacterium]